MPIYSVIKIVGVPKFITISLQELMVSEIVNVSSHQREIQIRSLLKEMKIGINTATICAHFRKAFTNKSCTLTLAPDNKGGYAY